MGHSGGSTDLPWVRGPGPRPVKTDSDDRRECLSVVLSNRATPQLLAALFSTLKLVFPAVNGKSQRKQPLMFLKTKREREDRCGKWAAHPRAWAGHDE